MFTLVTTTFVTAAQLPERFPGEQPRVMPVGPMQSHSVTADQLHFLDGDIVRNRRGIENLFASPLVHALRAGAMAAEKGRRESLLCGLPKSLPANARH